MKYFLLIPLVAASLSTLALHVRAEVFRCPGNSYTNNAAEAKAKGCKALEGTGVTVVEGTKVNGSAPARVATASTRPAAASTGDQRARDADARMILESELKKAEARQAELLKEYKNGEPDKQGGEARNYQKYLDRVAELKASIARNENDIAGIRRELGRVPAK
jgi:hypothetical protein